MASSILQITHISYRSRQHTRLHDYSPAPSQRRHGRVSLWSFIMLKLRWDWCDMQQTSNRSLSHFYKEKAHDSPEQEMCPTGFQFSLIRDREKILMFCKVASWCIHKQVLGEPVSLDPDQIVHWAVTTYYLILLQNRTSTSRNVHLDANLFCSFVSPTAFLPHKHFWPQRDSDTGTMVALFSLHKAASGVVHCAI